MSVETIFLSMASLKLLDTSSLVSAEVVCFQLLVNK